MTEYFKPKEVPDINGDLSEKKIIEAIVVHENIIDSYQRDFNPFKTCSEEKIKQFWGDFFKYRKAIKNVKEFLLLEHPAPSEKVKVLQEMLDESRHFKREYTDYVRWNFGEFKYP